MEANLARLTQAIEELQDESHTLAQLQYRARMVLERHKLSVKRSRKVGKN